MVISIVAHSALQYLTLGTLNGISYPNVLGLGNNQDMLFWGAKMQVCSSNKFSSNFHTNFSDGRRNLYLILCKLERSSLFLFVRPCVCSGKQCLQPVCYTVLFRASEVHLTDRLLAQCILLTKPNVSSLTLKCRLNRKS